MIMNYLAFDLGGSSGKLMLGTYEDGRLSLKRIHRFDNSPVDVDGSLYWDIDRIVDELRIGMAKAEEETGGCIDGIGFDSFCNDFVLINEGGERLAPVYCYRDARTLRNQDEMYRVMSKESLYAVNGNQIAPFNTLNQLHAMKAEGRQELLEKADKALFVSDYFIYLLTGVKQTEYTTASVTQMYDYGEGTWSAKILERYGIDSRLFAPLAYPGTLAGYTNKGIPVYTVCQHDTGSAFLASQGGANTGIISTGTWCIAGIETDGPVIRPEGFAINAANEGGFPGPHHRLLKNVMGTWIIQEMLRELNEQGDSFTYGDLEEMAQRSVGAEGYIDVDAPQFYQPGEMIRKVQDNLKEMTGRTEDNRGTLVYIVYKSLAFKYRMIFEQLEELTGKRIDRINMIGGGIQSGLMCRLTAQITCRQVQAGPEDATAIGNILAQMKASGAISSIEEGRQVIRESFPVETYMPEPDEIIEAEYRAFSKALRDTER